MNKTKYLTWIILLIACFTSIEVAGQARRPRIVSPEVHPEQTVTFRFSAPDADKVELNAQFLEERVALIKDTSGLWSVTVGQVEPDIYPYYFVVNGTVQVADPNNVHIFPNERFKNSLVDIPGDTPLIHTMQDVPHGKLHYRYYKSRSLDIVRGLEIYLPPGYDEKQDMEYPVLYLIHGATDTEDTWFKVGRVNLILDNLIAQGMAEPMIIAMPYANPSADLRNKGENIEVDFRRMDLFTTDLIDDVIPFIGSNYRTLEGADNLAVAGFSRGGGQTLAAGLGHPDVFAWVCAFAPAIFADNFNDQFGDLYASPEDLNAKLKLLWLSCGEDDGLYDSAVKFKAALEENDIQHQSFFTSGGHTWMNCKIFITETAQLLFK